MKSVNFADDPGAAIWAGGARSGGRGGFRSQPLRSSMLRGVACGDAVWVTD